LGPVLFQRVCKVTREKRKSSEISPESIRFQVNPAHKQIFRFGDVEVDVAQGCIRRGGQELHLRQQTFQVMVYLLTNRERIVTKEELLGSIWKETAVTDDALVQCVMDIRRAIGDDSRRPRFIKTIPKVGYRFISPVEEQPAQIQTPAVSSSLPEVDQDNHDNSQVSPQISPTSLSEARPVASQRRAGLIAAAIILVTATMPLAAYLRNKLGRNAKPIAEVSLPQVPGKQPVAVMYFDNQSGSADLDWLREGLADMIITDLSRSDKLSLLSRQQLHLLLERVGHNENEKIRLDEALDVARRSQARMVILGSFARLGEQIRIDVQLHNVQDGQLLAAERLVAAEPGQILTQVDLLSLKLASHLGASPTPDTGLTSVMTDNLQAYRYYSLGVEKAQAARNPEAIALLEKAIGLDPDFAMAYARIGYTYAVSWGLLEKGKPYLEKAFKLTDRLSEKDKLNINAWYALANQDYASAIKSFQEIVAHYPLDVEAYRGLGRLLRGENRQSEAIEILKQGLAIDSGAKELYNSLGGVYLQLGRHDEAIAMFQRYVELAPQEPNAHDSLGGGYQWAGRYPEAIQEYERALTLKPDFEVSIIHLANTLYQQGRYREALTRFQHYIEIAHSVSERARGYSGLAQVHRSKRRLDEAERAARLSLAHDKSGLGQMFSVALERGELSAAEKYKSALEKVLPRNRGGRGDLRELIYVQGIFELKSGHATEAIEKFKEALQHQAPTWNFDAYEDCLANAYLKLDRFDEAIAEYERILKLNPNYPLVQYHLGEAYERKGQQEQARIAYERFLQIWKDADADVPEVVAARQRLGK